MSESKRALSLYALLSQIAPPHGAEAKHSGSLPSSPDERPKPQPTTLTFTLESADYDSSAASTFVGLSR